MSDATADVLDDAADLIERYGWTVGHYGDEVNGFCSMGAILRASDHIRLSRGSVLWEIDDDVTNGAIKALGVQLGCDVTSYGQESVMNRVAFWNDTEAGDKQVVLDTLRAAAKRLRSDEPIELGEQP